MINWADLDSNSEDLRNRFISAAPFEHLVIDGFFDEERLAAALEFVPDPELAGHGRSRDYVFAKGKFEKARFQDLSSDWTEIYEDLCSERFRRSLESITGEAVFIDPTFHGGGLHQGGQGSYLDMHTDFNAHPMHRDWFRNLNILIYLNKDWRREYGGELKIRNARSGDEARIEPLFNRCVIFKTRDYTIHGYDPIRFPQGTFRRSLAAYAFTKMEKPVDLKLTQWYPDQSHLVRIALAKVGPRLALWKNMIFGSGTEKNK